MQGFSYSLVQKYKKIKNKYNKNCTKENKQLRKTNSDQLNPISDGVSDQHLLPGGGL